MEKRSNEIFAGGGGLPAAAGPYRAPGPRCTAAKTSVVTAANLNAATVAAPPSEWAKL
jgi:hypothetical protein